tara:strand:+ start:117 stop:944 length:828 start_codon:yes stop_codon:yes gene_type:complete
MEVKVLPNKLKKTLGSGGKVYGTMLWGIQGTRLIQTLNSDHIDYVVIEAEHAARTRLEINELTSVLRSKEITSIVRITSPNPEIAGAMIDAGADGILIPYTENIEELKLSFGRTYFNPLKGEYLKKVLDTGEFPSKKSEDYLRGRNKDKIFILGIESVPAMNNLEKMINSVEKIDGIFVGPNDLTTSMGIPDEKDSDLYVDALKKIISISESHSIPVMIHHATMQESNLSLSLGSRFVLHGSDASFLGQKIEEDFKKLRSGSTNKNEDTKIDKPY